MFWYFFLLVTCFKLLLIPSYHSTDFEVHRNWLAITHSLPIREWYVNNSSQWTLDYPPLFAWFEFTLSHTAKYLDPEMLQITNLEYASNNTILFQRLSVIVSDIIFALGAKECCEFIASSGIRSKGSKWSSMIGSPVHTVALLLLANAGLFILDHIHFQYNGMLFGILLLSIAKILKSKFLAGAILFSILINMKHIYIYCAPAYFIYLLRNACFNDSGTPTLSSFRIKKFISMGAAVLGVTLISFGPFFYYGQLGQVLSRLFPFKRGLCHAYWAPNFWALYNVFDKAAFLFGKKLGFSIPIESGVMTNGLVQEFNHSVLPSITPKLTFLLSLITMIPALVKLWRCPGNPLHFVRAVTLCSASAFLFGWHVHEKAILLVIIPISLLVVSWKSEARYYLLFSTIGHYSLFPLLLSAFEIPTKTLIFIIHTLYSFKSLTALYESRRATQYSFPLLTQWETIYLSGLLPLFLYENIFHRWFGLHQTLPFLPLLLVSFYCAIGITYTWLRYYWHFLTLDKAAVKRRIH